MTLALIVVVGTAIGLALLGWWQPEPSWPALALGMLIVALILAASGSEPDRSGRIVLTALVVLAAAAGGGPLTVAVLRFASAHARPRLPEPGRPDPRPVEDILRGGAWIGVLERLAVTVALIAGWPEGLAVVLAVKGLARYPELRAPGAGASERFIIGTFTSVLWATACAVVVLLVAR